MIGDYIWTKNVARALKKFFELFIGYAGIADNTFERVRVQAGVMGDGEFSFAVGHTDMLAAAFYNPKTCFYESADCTFRRNICEEHRMCFLGKAHFYLFHCSSFQVVFFHLKICKNRVLNVFKRFFFSSALAVASGKSWSMNIVTVAAFMNDNKIFHSMRILPRQAQ